MTLQHRRTSSSYSNFRKAIASFVTCISTIIFFNSYPQFNNTGDELLIDNNFLFGSANWRISRTGVTFISPTESAELGYAKLALESNDSSLFLTANQAIKLENSLPKFVRLRATIRTDKVIEGQANWQTARVTVMQLDEHGNPRLNIPYILITQQGSSSWTDYSPIIQISPDTRQLQASVELAHCKGEILVRSISLMSVIPNHEFLGYRNVLILIWLCLGLWIATPLVISSLTDISKIPFMAAVAVILYGVLIPEHLKQTLGQIVWPTLIVSHDQPDNPRLFKLSLTNLKIDIFKVGHMVTFAILSLTFFFKNARPTARDTLMMILFATISETLQLFTSGRGPQLGDILIDGIGICIGLALGGTITFIRQSKTNKPAPRQTP